MKYNTNPVSIGGSVSSAEKSDEPEGAPSSRGTNLVACSAVPTQVRIIRSPVPATPRILPAISCTGDTDDSNTSEMRVDFSSMVLISNPCVIVKIEIQRM